MIVWPPGFCYCNHSIQERRKKMYLLHNANAHQKKELTINNIQIRFDAFVIKFVGIRFLIKCYILVLLDHFL